MALGSDVVPREWGDRGRRVSNSASKEGAVLRREKGNRPKTRPPSPLSFVFIRFASSFSSSSVPTAVAAGPILDNVTHDQNLETAEEARRAEIESSPLSKGPLFPIFKAAQNGDKL